MRTECVVWAAHLQRNHRSFWHSCIHRYARQFWTGRQFNRCLQVLNDAKPARNRLRIMHVDCIVILPTDCSPSVTLGTDGQPRTIRPLLHLLQTLQQGVPCGQGAGDPTGVSECPLKLHRLDVNHRSHTGGQNGVDQHAAIQHVRTVYHMPSGAQTVCCWVKK